MIDIIYKGLTTDRYVDTDADTTTDTIRWRSDMDTDAETGFMHESFHKDDPKKFSREWFAWANTLFGELILKTFNERPEVLKSI